MKKIPIALIYLRLVLGAVLLALAFYAPPGYRIWAVVLFTVGLVSDIFDGIIARRLGVSTSQLRRLDSTVDQFFWICVAGATALRNPDFFYEHDIALLLLIGLEVLTYAVSFLRFKKEVATHALASKFWTLTLFATLVELMLTGQSTWLFQTCLYLGLLTRLEILAILVILKEWVHDVPSVYHAVLIRAGKPITRNKLFNG